MLYVISGERRTAAERLEESKANYVKTDRVLDTRQALKHSHGPHVVRNLSLAYR